MLPSIYILSYPTISLQLATFLTAVMSETQFLSNKALHLFLQTQLSMEMIKENLDGKRDDEVIADKDKAFKDDRKNAKDGFGALFGTATATCRILDRNFENV